MTVDDAVRSVLREEVRKIVREEFRAAVEELRTLPPATQKEFLSVEEAADLVDVSETTVREWLAKGLKQYKQGRVLRIRRSELLAFLSASNNSPEVGAEVDVEKRAVAILARSRRGS